MAIPSRSTQLQTAREPQVSSLQGIDSGQDPRGLWDPRHGLAGRPL